MDCAFPCMVTVSGGHVLKLVETSQMLNVDLTEAAGQELYRTKIL